MKAGRFEISGGLGEAEVRLVLDDVHRLLGEVGLEIEHDAIVKELAGHAGVTVEGGRVRYSPDLVETARSQVAAEDANYIMHRPGRAQFELQTPFSPFNVMDLETGEVRPACDRDVTDGARLVEALGGRGPAHVHIAGMDQRIAQIHIARLCCESSRAVGNWMAVYSYDQAKCVQEMYAAAGRPEPWIALQMTHSPMRLDAYYLDILYRGRSSEMGNRGITGGGGSMPQPGVSSPVYWRSAAAQGLAEALGAWITIKLIDPSVHPYSSFTTSVTDMTDCTGWSRTPESFPYALLNRQIMLELLGTVEGAYTGDLRGMFLSALQGARIFGGAGGRGEDVFSPAHAVIDREKLGYVEAALAGVEYPAEEGLTARIHSETLPETSFLMHESSLEFRSIHWQPAVFTGIVAPALARMLYEDSDELLPPAREKARELVASSDFRLDDSAAREVSAAYERGVKALALE